MKVVLKYKFYFLFFALLAAIYFLLRLPNLTLQPIFADEAIYIRWAQVMRSEPTLRFLPLSDGKTPFFMWAMIPMFKIFDDPLLAGRLLSVLTGFVTMIGVFVLSWRVFGPKAAYLSALFYAVTPYTVFFDRMALVDSMLATFTVWSIYFALWLLKSQRLDLSMILGVLMGIALLVKTPAMVNLLALPLTIVGFGFKKRDRYSLLKLLGLWVVSSLIALGIYNILRLGPGFTQLSSRNADYMFSPTELIGRPLDPFIPHLRDILSWVPGLVTWPIAAMIMLGIIFLFIKRHRLGLCIFLWLLVPVILEMTFLKTFTARYLLLAVPPLLCIAGFGASILLVCFPFKLLNWGLLIFLLLPVYIDSQIITRPQDAPLPKNERRGYLEDWTAGYGFPQIAQFLIEQKKEGSVVLGTEGYFGTLPDGLLIYLDKANISVVGGSATISAQLKEAAQDNQTFFVGNKNRLEAHIDGVKLIEEYPKAQPRDLRPRDAIMFYKVLP